MWSEKQRLFLSINKTEHKLLSTLQKHGSLNTRTLSFEADVPRVTAIRVLRRLLRRGFVSRQVLKLETRWSLINPSLLERKLNRDTDASRVAPKETILSDVASVTTYRGAQEMFASNRKILIAHAGERIYCIEPNAIWKHAAKIPATDWIHLNRLVKQKGIVAEVILEQGFEKVLGMSVQKDWSDSFFAFASDVRVVPRGALSSGTELIIFRDQALFLDWEDLVTVEIKSPNTLKVLRGMFRALQFTATPLVRRV